MYPQNCLHLISSHCILAKIIQNSNHNMEKCCVSNKYCGVSFRIVAAFKNRLAWESLACLRTEIFHGAVPVPEWNLHLSNIVILFVRSSHMISLTNENKVLLWRRIHNRALEPLHCRFLFIYAQTILKQTNFLTPQLLLLFSNILTFQNYMVEVCNRTMNDIDKLLINGSEC